MLGRFGSLINHLADAYANYHYLSSANLIVDTKRSARDAECGFFVILTLLIDCNIPRSSGRLKISCPKRLRG